MSAPASTNSFDGASADSKLQTAIANIDDVINAMLQGDAEPMKEIWSSAAGMSY